MRYFRQISGIPEIFHSHATKGVFENCTICDAHLLNDDTPYVIEKSIKQYSGFDKHDVIFEYALCLNCTEKLKNSISADSALKIQTFFDKNLNTEERLEYLTDQDTDNVDKWLETCAFTGKNRFELEEYQIIGFFHGKNTILADTPYMIAVEVSEQINEFLSQQTKDEMDRFKDQFLGPPPELEELFKRRKILLI